MGKEKLILDFDGTLTDVGVNYHLYDSRFREEFSLRTGISESKLKSLQSTVEDQIRGDPMRGWEYDGVIICPAQVDPFALNATVYQDISKRLGLPESERDEIIDECFQNAYSIVPTIFRDGIESFLGGVQQKYDATVVINSSTAHASEELGSIGFSDIPIIGSAKKYVIDSSWDGVPNSVQSAKFPRPVMLRRKMYASALESIGALNGNATVMGDIYEMDLALPEHLGMSIVHMVNESTPAHEIDYIAKSPRGSTVRNLEEASKVLLD